MIKSLIELKEYFLMENTMKVISATEAKTHFGKYINVAMFEPVTVSKTGQETIVMISKRVVCI